MPPKKKTGTAASSTTTGSNEKRTWRASARSQSPIRDENDIEAHSATIIDNIDNNINNINNDGNDNQPKKPVKAKATPKAKQSKSQATPTSVKTPPSSKRKAVVSTTDLISETISLLDDGDGSHGDDEGRLLQTKRPNRTRSFNNKDAIDTTIPANADIVDISLSQSQQEEDRMTKPPLDFKFLLKPIGGAQTTDRRPHVDTDITPDTASTIQQIPAPPPTQPPSQTKSKPKVQSDQPPPGVLPTKPLKSQSCLHRFADATAIEDLQSVYIPYNTTDKIPNPLTNPINPLLQTQTGANTTTNNSKSKGNTSNKTAATTATPLQKGKFKNQPNFDLFLSLHELCTLFLILTGQLSFDADDVFTYLDQVYQTGSEWVVQQQGLQIANYAGPDLAVTETPHKNSKRKSAKSSSSSSSSSTPPTPQPPNLLTLINPSTPLNLGSFDLKDSIKHSGLPLYHQLIPIPPSKLYIDAEILSQLCLGSSARHQLNPTELTDPSQALPHTLVPLQPPVSTHRPLDSPLQYSNLIKQADKYGDYDGLCSFVDFLNITRTAGLWIDTNYDLYS